MLPGVPVDVTGLSLAGANAPSAAVASVSQMNTQALQSKDTVDPSANTDVTTGGGNQVVTTTVRNGGLIGPLVSALGPIIQPATSGGNDTTTKASGLLDLLPTIFPGSSTNTTVANNVGNDTGTTTKASGLLDILPTGLGALVTGTLPIVLSNNSTLIITPAAASQGNSASVENLTTGLSVGTGESLATRDAESETSVAEVSKIGSSGTESAAHVTMKPNTLVTGAAATLNAASSGTDQPVQTQGLATGALATSPVIMGTGMTVKATTVNKSTMVNKNTATVQMAASTVRASTVVSGGVGGGGGGASSGITPAPGTATMLNTQSQATTNKTTAANLVSTKQTSPATTVPAGSGNGAVANSNTGTSTWQPWWWWLVIVACLAFIALILIVIAIILCCCCCGCCADTWDEKKP